MQFQFQIRVRMYAFLIAFLITRPILIQTCFLEKTAKSYIRVLVDIKTYIKQFVGSFVYFLFLYSCLKAIRTLQVNGHIPSESAIFRTYAE